MSLPPPVRCILLSVLLLMGPSCLSEEKRPIPCSTGYCEDDLSVSFGYGGLPSGDWEIAVHVPGGEGWSCSCSVVNGFGESKACTPGLELVQHPSIGNYMGLRLHSTPPSVTVSVRRDGEAVGQREYSPEYVSVGDCGDGCKKAEVSFCFTERCEDQLRINFVDGVLPSGKWSIAVWVHGREEFGCSGTVVNGIGTEQSCTPGMELIRDWTGVFSGLRLHSAPDSATVIVRRDGEVVVRKEYSPQYHIEFPNGDCDDGCKRTELELLPGGHL